MRLFGKKPKPAKARLSLPRWMLARFDAAQTTKDNARHWSAAEFLSADAEADSNVRKILRTRARYEVQNNSYARGIVKTLADDTVGTGPRLQMLLEDEAKNRLVEHDFAEWAKRIRLAAKLRTIRMARCQDGEAFAVLAQNPRLSTNVTLDIQLIEADRVTDDEMNADGRSVDGITFDSFGNPVSYNVLKAHPGGTASFGTDSVTVKAENMIHVFRQDRPEQHRGIPEITSALPLFAHLRRFTLAVVSAAEAAADFAGVLYTDAPPNGESLRNMMVRCYTALNSVILDMMQEDITEAAVMTHSGILMNMMSCFGLPKYKPMEFACPMGHGYEVLVTAQMWQQGYCFEILGKVPDFGSFGYTDSGELIGSEDDEENYEGYDDQEYQV